jgi:hypothetical protein
MAKQADIQETAQALFCALADYHGVAGIEKVFNEKEYPSYFDFKSFWNKKYPNATIEKTFSKKLLAGKASLSEVEDLLYGVKEKSKSKKTEWYRSSLNIASKLMKDISTISKNFNYLKTKDWSDVFYAQGDKEVMDNIAKLYKKANDNQKALIENKNKHKDPAAEIIKIPRPFENINKWSTADIYFASDDAKKQINDLISEKKLDYTKLNAFISKMIASGDILPLSLKKQPRQVEILKVNFNRPQEQRDIDKLEYGGISSWKMYNEKDDINSYTRTLIVYMSKDKTMQLQMRHDPSSEGYKGVIQVTGAGAFEGSLSAGPIADILCTIDLSFGNKWYKVYQTANRIFKDYKVTLDEELKEKDRKQYDEKREKASAKVTNEVNPVLINWLNKNKQNADLFIRNVYTYATARSTNSSKYVLAK